MSSRRHAVAVLGTLLSLFGSLRPFPTGPLGAAAAEARARRTAGQYLVFERTRNGKIRLAYHRQVVLDAPLVSRTEDETKRLMARPSRGAGRIAARLLDDAGRTVYRDVVEIPQWLRGEFDTGGAIERTTIAVERQAFVVRVPFLARGRLELRDEETVAAFDLKALPSVAPPPPATVRAASIVGDPANRVDQLIMGDGYTAAQEAQFEADAADVADRFFAVSPYAEYGNFVNVNVLFTPSAEAGADHPPYNPDCESSLSPSCCADPAAEADPLSGTFVDTAFDASFCTFNQHRLLAVDGTKVLEAASVMPDWDVILVVVNDPTYGGSGGTLSVFSVDAAAIEIARHEYGHTFTRLADEYDAPFPDFPRCSDVDDDEDPCEPNVTDQTRRSDIKWSPWILPGTPLPTPDTDTYENAVGLFEGARFRDDMYRPQHTCRMQMLGAPFCDICRQEYILRLYRGGWGYVPQPGIDNIEPGSETPPPGDVTVTFPEPVTFSVDLLTPVGGPPLTVSWRVDDEEVEGETSSSFTYTPRRPGTVDVELRTRDDTTFVHADMAGDLLDHRRTWHVTFTRSGNTTTTTGEPTTTVSVTTTLGQQATTPTTTIPAARCEVTPTFGSLRCRVAVLSDATGAALATGVLRTGLLRKLEAVTQQLDAAEELRARTRVAPARRAISTALRKLRGFEHRLASRAARKALAVGTRGILGEMARQIADDLRLLRATP